MPVLPDIVILTLILLRHQNLLQCRRQSRLNLIQKNRPLAPVVIPFEKCKLAIALIWSLPQEVATRFL